MHIWRSGDGGNNSFRMYATVEEQGMTRSRGRRKGLFASAPPAALLVLALLCCKVASIDSQASSSEPGAAVPGGSATDQAATDAGAATEQPPPLPHYCAKYSKDFLPSIWTDLQPWSRCV